MAVAHRASIAASSVNPTTTFVVTIPASVVTGDVLFCAFTSRDHLVGTALPTCVDNDTGGNTWTRIGGSTDRKSHVFWKRATSATASKVITVAGCVGSCSGGVSAYSGAVTTGDPFTDFVVETNASADETHTTFTPTEANSFVCITVHNYANDNAITGVTCTNPGALATRYEKLSTGGSDCATIFASGGPQAGGPTATGSITWTQATNGVSYSIAFAIKPQVGAGFTLTADSATFSFTPNAVSLVVANKLPITSASFAITPTVPIIRKASRLAAVAASFVLSAQLVGLSAARRLSADSASFALTPNAVSLRAARYLLAEPPMRIPTGLATGVSDTEITFSWSVVDVVTGLAVEGISDTELSLSWNPVASAVDYYISPNEVTLARGLTMPADSGTFFITVNDARIFKTPAALIAEPPLTTPINLTATNDASELLAFITLEWDQGPAFHIDPNDVGLAVARYLSAQSASFAITPFDISFPSGFSMAADSASFTWTPNAAGLSVARKLSAQSGTYSITPNDVQLRTARVLHAQSASFSLTPFDVVLTYTPMSSFTLEAESATFSFVPNDVGLIRTRVLIASPAVFTFTGFGVTFTVGTGQILNEPFFINLSTGQTFIHINTNQTFIDIE